MFLSHHATAGSVQGVQRFRLDQARVHGYSQYLAGLHLHLQHPLDALLSLYFLKTLLRLLISLHLRHRSSLVTFNVVNI